MVRVGHKKIKFSTFSYLVFIFVFITIFTIGGYLRAQNINNLIEILNLAQGQVLNQNYTLKFETTNSVEFVKLNFIRLDVSSSTNKYAFARQENDATNIWYYDLDIGKLGNGIYRLETIVGFNDGTELAGQTRNFNVAQDSLPLVSLKIIQPEPEQVLNGRLLFTAQSNTVVEEITFSIYNNFGVLVKQYISHNLNSTTTHQIEINSDELGSDGRYQLVVQFISANNVVTKQSVFFYLANSTDRFTTTSTLPVRLSIITPIDNEKLNGKILLQAKVSEPVREVFFRLNGNLISARKYDNNLWQEYILTSNYPSGENELLAVARTEGKEYYSDIVKIFFISSTTTDKNIDIEKNQPTSSNYFVDEPLIVNPPNPTFSIENLSVSSTIKDNSVTNQFNNSASVTSTSVDDLYADCLNQDVKNISCAAYFRNEQNITGSCIEKVLNRDDCLEKNEQCLRDGVTNYDLCERYLTEPRASRWCDLAEFRKEPLCADYVEQKNNVITTNSNLNPFCIQQSIYINEECQKFLDYLKLPSECKQAGIITKEKCKEFLSGQILSTACQLAGSNDTASCSRNLINKYQNKAYCLEGDDCKNRLNLFVNELAAREISLRILEQAKIKFANGFISNENLQQPELQNLLPRLPINIKEKTNYQLLSAQEEVVVADNYLVKPLPALLIKDTDQDGVSDDIEKRLGTNVNLTDTDNDGYSDFLEIKNGYNPLLPNEKWQKSLAAVEKALFEGAIFEHPKIAGQVSNDLQIEMITNVTPEESEEANLLLRGSGPAFSVLSLYIYSDIPLLATVQVDEYGRWQYALADNLVNGEHEVYLVINDETGKIQKKSPAQIFFINEAKAVSANEFIDFTQVKDITLLEKYYIEGAIILIIFAIIIFFLVRRRHGKSESLVT